VSFNERMRVSYVGHAVRERTAHMDQLKPDSPVVQLPGMQRIPIHHPLRCFNASKITTGQHDN
jgi:hypothetical protein